ncbi:MAG: SDR family NAD(P)-dependent oxidoreductase [Bacteroidetes bacterium]|nr:MAG: SDR family NAD(P)-dependent oxidoreductase [Bacteroidota bacterium]
MTRKAVVTGAYGAIGKAIVQGIAGYGLEVILAGRDEGKLQRTVSAIRKRLPDALLGYAALDLSREKEIREFSEAWEGPLHVLVNNVATCPRARTETPEGIEMQWAANVLGYYWMILSFAPHMKEQPDARIVNVASYWAGGLNFGDLEFTSRYYDNDTAYRQSKQANRMLSAGFAKRLQSDGIKVNVCHPGDVISKVSSDLGYGGSETPEQGADTPVWLATSAEVENLNGHYFEHREKRPCPFMSDTRGVERLLEVCAGYSGRQW